MQANFKRSITKSAVIVWLFITFTISLNAEYVWVNMYFTSYIPFFQLSFEEPSADIVLVSAGSTVLQTTAVQVTRLAHELQVREINSRQLTDLCPGLRLKHGLATRLDAKNKVSLCSFLNMSAPMDGVCNRLFVMFPEITALAC